MLKVKIDEKIVDKSAAEVRKERKDHRIYTRDRYLHKGLVLVHLINMDKEVAGILGEHPYTAIIGQKIFWQENENV